MTPTANLPKVSLICEGLVTATGGAERVLCDLANHLAARGYDVDVVTHEFARGPTWYPLSDKVRHVALRPARDNHGTLRRCLGEPLRRAASAALRAARLDRVPGFGRLAWIDSQGGFWRRLELYLAQNRRDVAIAFMPRAMVALALAHTHYPLARIASTHSTPKRNFDSRDDDNANPSLRALTRAALDRFDRICVLLPEFRAWYPPELEPKVIVIPNAVTPTLSEKPRNPEKLVLAVGRHLPVKGHDVLIDAWALTAPKAPGWQLEIYGRGPETPRFQAQIDRLGLTQGVALKGTTKDIARQYARAAILAHPSDQEGFALAVAEALAAGVPTVGFVDCPGVNSLIRDGENGVLVLPGPDRQGRVEALAATLAGLIADDARRITLSKGGPPSVAQFAPATVMAQWERLILDSCKSQPMNSER